MKLFRTLVLFVFSVVMISSCFQPPEYPLTPAIEFQNIEFIDVADPNSFETATDTLALSIRFKDGDGDVGIYSGEVGPPFNNRWYYLKTPLAPPKNEPGFDPCTTYNGLCWKYYLTQLDKFIRFSDKKKLANKDTLPPFATPYSCTRWEVIRNDQGVVVDTLLFKTNPHYSNMYVEFQTKNNDGTFTIFDWSRFLVFPGCEVNGFNGRVPVLNITSDEATPLEGVIRYSMRSPFFKLIFGAKTVRLKVYIEDRAFNKSNEILTREFTFQ